MSVGHTARALEAAGIATVAIFIRAFRHQAEFLKVPRTLITPHLMGRTVGPPGKVERQRQVVRAALDLLAHADHPGSIVEFPDRREQP